MDDKLSKLATDIVNTIEREDFIYAMKHYGSFKIKKTAKELSEWWDEV